MEYQAIVKQFEGGDGNYHIIDMTNLLYHSNRSGKSSVGKVVRKAFNFKMGKESRIYAPLTDEAITDKKAYVINLLKNDPGFIQWALEEEKKGYKILLKFPLEDLPAGLGQDAVDTLAKVDKDNRIQLIHRSQGKTWRADEKGVE
jgi:hypothetical protein